MRVLVACEFSGTVRDAFLAKGHDAWSCDLIPSERPGPHLLGDARGYFDRGWDLLVCHPPCTLLCRAGARWWKGREAEQEEALALVRDFLAAPVPFIALENPPGAIGTRIRPADQTVQPWWFGDEASKQTCLWLKNLPRLVPTQIVGKGEHVTLSSGKRMPSWYNLPPSPDRGKDRSRTFAGFAAAMAEQWGSYVEMMS